jgi:hypothetical protein
MPCDSIDSSLFNACTKIRVVKGNITKFWTSRWQDGASSAEITSSLFNMTRFKKADGRASNVECHMDDWPKSDQQ